MVRPRKKSNKRALAPTKKCLHKVYPASGLNPGPWDRRGGGYTNHYYTTQHTTYKGETHIETLIQGINLNDERTIAGKERKEGRWKMVKEEVNGKTKTISIGWN